MSEIVLKKSTRIILAIISFIVALGMLYGAYVTLFVTTTPWISNILMLYINFFGILTFLSLFIGEKMQKKSRQDKVLPYGIDVSIWFAFGIMFGMAAWWYYATVSLISAVIVLSVYAKRNDDVSDKIEM